jgi:hypothetical protein
MPWQCPRYSFVCPEFSVLYTIILRNRSQSNLFSFRPWSIALLVLAILFVFLALVLLMCACCSCCYWAGVCRHQGSTPLWLLIFSRRISCMIYFLIKENHSQRLKNGTFWHGPTWIWKLRTESYWIHVNVSFFLQMRGRAHPVSPPWSAPGREISTKSRRQSTGRVLQTLPV